MLLLTHLDILQLRSNNILGLKLEMKLVAEYTALVVCFAAT